MSTPHIRPVRPEEDKSALDKIYRATCNSSLQHEPAWTYSSFLFCHPYRILSPETCFVLDAGDGTAVGYVIGTPNTRGFAARWPQEYLPQLDHSVLPPPDRHDAEEHAPPTWDSDLPAHLLELLYSKHVQLLNGDYPDMLDQYPAHLHIDILPEYQRQGWGRKMIDTFCDAIKKHGTSALHLGTEVSNVDSRKFYERLGFVRFQRVLSDGVDGRYGETPTVIYMVKDLE